MTTVAEETQKLKDILAQEPFSQSGISLEEALADNPSSDDLDRLAEDFGPKIDEQTKTEDEIMAQAEDMQELSNSPDDIDLDVEEESETAKLEAPEKETPEQKVVAKVVKKTKEEIQTEQVLELLKANKEVTKDMLKDINPAYPSDPIHFARKAGHKITTNRLETGTTYTLEQ